MMIYRKVKPNDAEQFVKLGLLVWRSAYKHIFTEEVFKDREERSVKKIEEFAATHYNDNTKICYVAEDGERIVGFMCGVIKSDYAHFGELGFADLTALYVHPDYQRLRIGENFKKIFESWAKSNGATKYVIGVLKDNKKARAAYEKWGGKLDPHTRGYEKLGVAYPEVYYTYEIK